MLPSSSNDSSGDTCNSKAVLLPSNAGVSQDAEQTEDDKAAEGEIAAAAAGNEFRPQLPLQEQDVSEDTADSKP